MTKKQINQIFALIKVYGIYSEETQNNMELLKRRKNLLYILKILKETMDEKKYKLISSNGEEYLSDIPGLFGGNKKLKIYGRLDCPSARRWISKGMYVSNRVFFENEETAIAANYRPCAICMPKEYKEWKEKEKQKDIARKRFTNN